MGKPADTQGVWAPQLAAKPVSLPLLMSAAGRSVVLRPLLTLVASHILNAGDIFLLPGIAKFNLLKFYLCV